MSAESQQEGFEQDEDSPKATNETLKSIITESFLF